MRVRYRRLVVPMDCAMEDDSEPVLLELTTKGEIVIHNYDSTPEEVALVYGYNMDDFPCMVLLGKWDEIIVDSVARPSSLSFYEKVVPKKVMQQLLRVGPLLKEAAYEAYKKSTYRKPASHWVDRAGMSFDSYFYGPASKVIPRVTGVSEKVWHSKYGKRNYPGVAVSVRLITTVPDYITLLNKIPDGVVYDKKQDTWCLAASIQKVINRNSIIIMAGKQGRGVSVDPREASVTRGEEGHWFVKKWI